VPFAGFPESQVTINGKTKGYTYTADSGAKATINFCPEKRRLQVWSQGLADRQRA
jgi:hypothetical protein